MLKVSRWCAPLVAAGAVSVLAATAATGAAHQPNGSAASGPVNLKIGIVAGETGSEAQIGQAFVANAKLGIATINAQLKKAGLSNKYSVTLTGTGDTQLQSQEAIAACQQAVNVNGSEAIIGDYASSTTIPCAQSVTIPKGVPIFTGGSSPLVTELPEKNLVWRMLPSDGYGGEVAAEYLAKKFGKGAKINISYENDSFGQPYEKVVAAALKQRGLKVGATVAINPTAPSFTSEAQLLTANHPSGWFNIIYCAEWGKLRPQLEQTGAWSATKTVNSAESNQCPAPTQLNAGITGVQSVTYGGAGYGAYLKAYAAGAHGVSNQQSVVPAFDASYLAFLAAVAAKSDNPAQWKNDVRSVSGPSGEKFDWQQLPQAVKALQAGKKIDYQGVSGDFDFTSTGNPGTASFGIWKANGHGGRTFIGTIKPDKLVK